jgi:hypothetical protein
MHQLSKEQSSQVLFKFVHFRLCVDRTSGAIGENSDPVAFYEIQYADFVELFRKR